MYYVPAFFETFLVLVLAIAVLSWVRRRNDKAGLAIPVLIGGVMLPMLWGGVALWAEDLGSVTPARFTGMGFALFGLVGSLLWAAAVWGQPVVDDDQPA